MPVSEFLFEQFCDANRISWVKLPTGKIPTPDYRVSVNGDTINVEIKQIESTDCSAPLENAISHSVGVHVRQKIDGARKQLQASSKAGIPCILLIYNAVDPMQLLGTEKHDFLAAMYGDMTLLIKNTVVADSFYGRNSKLRPKQNTSFSALGHLRNSHNGPTVRLFENSFARIPLNYESLPSCFEVVRIEIAD